MEERYVKYGRTYHLPWTEAATEDDKILSYDDIIDMFVGREVVMTEKADGENTSIYADGYCHARSLDSKAHPSRAWVRKLAAEVSPNLPEGWHIVGENVYAQHSIPYNRLPSFFLVFGMVDETDTVLSWDDITTYAEMLNLKTAPVIYRGLWDEKKIRSLWTGKSLLSTGEGEGYVVRLADAFPSSELSRSIAKFVRKGHVQTDEHWIHRTIIVNKLA